MAIFIATVKRQRDGRYLASFPDFLACTVIAPTVERVVIEARQALAGHIESLLGAGHRIRIPTSADAVERNDASFLLAVDVPDDVGMAHVELTVPALSLARMEAFAHHLGLTRSALFLEAVSRWIRQEASAPDRRNTDAPDGPTLFDFVNPLELKVESIGASVGPEPRAPDEGRNRNSRSDAEAADDITAELVRLLEVQSRTGMGGPLPPPGSEEN
jgi:predicted RNase H-like HicB family nuclease